MNKLYLASTSTVVALVLATTGVAFAQQGSGEAGMGVTGPGLQVQANVQTSVGAQGSAQEEGSEGNQERGQEQSQMNIHANATGTMMQQQNRETNMEGSASSSGQGEMHAEMTNEQNQNQGEMHQNEMANVVQNLLGIADRAGGIGSEVRAAAEAQASTTAMDMSAMQSLDSESGAKVFFLGPDYKSLGELRSVLVTTQNNIQRLTQAMQQTSDAAVQAQLQTQIQAMQNKASSTSAYIEAHANVFSLFGWFVRLFNQ